MRSCEFVKFMFRKINDCIWGGNDRLCSLNRGKRVLFTVSAGWTRHSEWDKYRRRHNIYCSRYVDCAIYRGGVVGAIDRRVTDACHTSASALSALTATYHRTHTAASPAATSAVHAAPRPWAARQPAAAHLFRLDQVVASGGTRPTQSRRSFIFISRPQLDGSLAAASGGAGRGSASATWLEYTQPPPSPQPRRDVNFVMSKVDNYATQVAFTFWISLKLVDSPSNDWTPNLPASHNLLTYL